MEQGSSNPENPEASILGGLPPDEVKAYVKNILGDKAIEVYLALMAKVTTDPTNARHAADRVMDIIGLNPKLNAASSTPGIAINFDMKMLESAKEGLGALIGANDEKSFLTPTLVPPVPRITPREAIPTWEAGE